MSIVTPAGIALGILVLAAAIRPAEAQQQARTVAAITLQEAKTAMDAAEAEAVKNGWKLVFVISDAEGTPIYLRRMDGVPKRNHDIAMSKVSTAIRSGMNTADYAAAVRAGTMQPLEGAVTFDGGILLRRNGQIVGAFSASGASGAQDAQAVRAGMAAIGLPAGTSSAGGPAAAAPATTPAGSPAPAPAGGVRVPSSVLERYVGEYEVRPGLTVVVRLRGDSLTGQPTGQPESLLVPISETKFRVGGGQQEVEFVTEKDGSLTKVLRAGGQEIRAPRKGK